MISLSKVSLGTAISSPQRREASNGLRGGRRGCHTYNRSRSYLKIGVRTNVPGYGAGEEGGSEVVAEVSGRQCLKGSFRVNDRGGIERVDAFRQQAFQYNHPCSTTYWRTWRTIKLFASTQNWNNHWVHAEPAAWRKPFE